MRRRPVRQHPARHGCHDGAVPGLARGRALDADPVLAVGAVDLVTVRPLEPVKAASPSATNFLPTQIQSPGNSVLPTDSRKILAGPLRCSTDQPP